MGKRNLVDTRQKNLFRVLTWAFGVMTLTALVLTIVYWSSNLLYLFIMLTLCLCVVWMLMCGIYHMYINMSRLAVLLTQDKIEDQLLQQIAQRVFDSQSRCTCDGVTISCFVDKKMQLSVVANIDDDYTLLEVECGDGRVNFTHADRYNEELHDMDWTDSYQLDELFADASFDDFVQYIKHYHQAKAQLNISYIHDRLVDNFAKGIPARKLQRNKVTGKKSRTKNIIKCCNVDYLQGERADIAFGKVINESALVYSEKYEKDYGYFAQILDASNIAKELEQTSNLVVVDTHYQWLYIVTQEQHATVTYFATTNTN